MPIYTYHTHEKHCKVITTISAYYNVISKWLNIDNGIERACVPRAYCCIELRFFGIYICVRDSGGNSTKNTCYKKRIHVRSPIHPISNSVTYKRNEIWFWNMHERKFSHKNIESHPLLDNDRTFYIITTTTPEYYLGIHLCT